jgi:hypothetical protein
MAPLGLGHLAQDRGIALTHASRDELVHSSSEDLASPCLQQALPRLIDQRGPALRSDWTRHGRSSVPGRGKAYLNAA